MHCQSPTSAAPESVDPPDDKILPAAARVLLVDVEPALAALLAEWLAAAGIASLALCADELPALQAPAALIAAAIPFPRQGGAARLRALAAARPGTPILALSPTFFTGIAARGAVARELGVAAVLATPVDRATWLAAVGRLLEPAG